MRNCNTLIILCLLLVSCSKEGPQPQKILPQPYFPAYPGSTWTYVDDPGATVTYSTGPEYVYNEFEIDGKRYRGLVPVYEGKYVWLYAFGTEITRPRKFMDDEKPAGATIYSSHHQGNSVRSYILARDTSIEVNGINYSPTIVVEDRFEGGGSVITGRKYYTRDVGLVKEEQFTMNEVSNTLSLVSYSINR